MLGWIFGGKQLIYANNADVIGKTSAEPVGLPSLPLYEQ
jgi:hypothetical protein